MYKKVEVTYFFTVSIFDPLQNKICSDKTHTCTRIKLFTNIIVWIQFFKLYQFFYSIVFTIDDWFFLRGHIKNQSKTWWNNFCNILTMDEVLIWGKQCSGNTLRYAWDAEIFVKTYWKVVVYACMHIGTGPSAVHTNLDCIMNQHFRHFATNYCHINTICHSHVLNLTQCQNPWTLHVPLSICHFISISFEVTHSDTFTHKHTYEYSA